MNVYETGLHIVPVCSRGSMDAGILTTPTRVNTHMQIVTQAGYGRAEVINRVH